MKKKFIVLLTAIMCTFMLCGCSGTSEAFFDSILKGNNGTLGVEINEGTQGLVEDLIGGSDSETINGGSVFNSDSNDTTESESESSSSSTN